jgi:hypothetical protein
VLEIDDDKVDSIYYVGSRATAKQSRARKRLSDEVIPLFINYLRTALICCRHSESGSKRKNENTWAKIPMDRKLHVVALIQQVCNIIHQHYISINVDSNYTMHLMCVISGCLVYLCVYAVCLFVD